MIPKVIHYTWFSGEPFPEKIQYCMDSWHQYMSEYEYVLWDAERIKEIDSVWLQECLSEKKWAFAADFVRLYAIYHYGGIYLDTDCCVYKSFDGLLDNKCFIGKEHSIHVEGRSTQMYLTSHCFGAEKGNAFIGRCLSYYENRHFRVSTDQTLPMLLKYSALLLPYIQSELAKQIGYNPFPSKDVEQNLNDVTVYPSSYFDVTEMTKDAYCRHLALGGWRDSRTPDEAPTLGYKIRWRVERFLRNILEAGGYLLIKKQ